MLYSTLISLLYVVLALYIPRVHLAMKRGAGSYKAGYFYLAMLERRDRRGKPIPTEM